MPIQRISIEEARSLLRQPSRARQRKQDDGADVLMAQLRALERSGGILADARCRPEREYWFAKSAIDRDWRFDLAWPAERLALEVDGGIWVDGRHVQPQGRLDDIDKYNAAAFLGWTVMTVSTQDVRNGRAIRLLEVWFGRENRDTVPDWLLGKSRRRHINDGGKR